MLSNSGGVTRFPVTATLIREKRSPAFAPSSPASSRSDASSALCSKAPRSITTSARSSAVRASAGRPAYAFPSRSSRE